MMPGKAMVIGGTGHFGREITNALIESGYEVTVFTRDMQKAKYLFPFHVNFLQGKIEEVNWLDLLQGFEAVVISLSAFNKHQFADMIRIEFEGVRNLLLAASDQKIERLIYLSVFNLGPVSDSIQRDTASVKQAVERLLFQSEINTSVIALPTSTKLFFDLVVGKKKKRMVALWPEPPVIPAIAPRDVGNVVAECLPRKDLDKQRIRLTGPDLLSFSKAASIIAGVTQQPVRLLKIPYSLPGTVYQILRVLAFTGMRMKFYKKMLAYVLALKKHDAKTVEEVKALQEKNKQLFATPLTSFAQEAERHKDNL